MWLVAFLFFFFFLALDCPRKTDAATLHRVMMIKEELRFFFLFLFFLKKKNCGARGSSLRRPRPNVLGTGQIDSDN